VERFLGIITYWLHGILKDAFTSTGIIVVCDGSYKSPFATGAWIVTLPSCYPRHYLLGMGRSPGCSEDQDSHRGEATALLGAMVSLQTLYPGRGKLQPGWLLFAVITNLLWNIPLIRIAFLTF
jgi:hypothetical protein